MAVPVPVVVAAFDLLRHGVTLVQQMQARAATEEEVQALIARIVESNTARWNAGVDAWETAGEKAPPANPPMPRSQ